MVFSPTLSAILHDLRHKIAHLFCCTFLHLPRDVGVDAEREAHVEVTKHTGYRFHVYAIPPTEMSISPAIITIVIPIDATPITAPCESTETRLFAEKNTGTFMAI